MHRQMGQQVYRSMTADYLQHKWKIVLDNLVSDSPNEIKTAIENTVAPFIVFLIPFFFFGDNGKKGN